MRRPGGQELGRYFVALLFTVGTLVAVASVRMLWDGHHHLKEAKRLVDANDRALAVVELESAAKAYVPGGPYTKRALRELVILARGAEMRGEVKEAAHIWEVVRRSIIATRNLYQPSEDQLKIAEAEVVRLNSDSGGSDSKPTDRVMRPDDPSPLASLLLFVGILCWAGGAVALMMTSKRTPLTSTTMRTAFWIVCLGGLILWLVMAWLAG